MSKLLSQLLDAKEPQFHQTLSRLEAASGHPAHDIRLGESIRQTLNAKLQELNLDPADTTNEELFHALQAKLSHDDALLIKRLRQISAYKVNAAANLSEGIAAAVMSAVEKNLVFALKGSVLKKALLKFPPKQTMKALNFRSIDSMYKHLPLGLMVPVALEIEGAGWSQHYAAFLKTLKAADFEERAISVYSPHSEKWQSLRSKLFAVGHQTVITNKELASLVVLQLPNRPVPGLATLTLAAAANGLNSIYAFSSYLRLSQVAKDFGSRVYVSASQEPQIDKMDYFSEPLNWETVVRFVHHMHGELGSSLDLHIGAEELIGWQPVEHLIHQIAPEMAFWRDCGHVGRVSGSEPVSLNVTDNALSLVNRKNYSERYSHHAKRSLMQELISKYIRPELLSEAVNADLTPKLAAETVTA